MSYHIGLIIVTVTALAVGQFFIELFDTPHNHAPEDYLKVPLLDRDQSVSLRNLPRSKLDGIMIHPNGSNATHADISVMEMGNANDSYSRDMESWGAGKGKGTVNGRLHSQQQFRIDDTSDNASD